MASPIFDATCEQLESRSALERLEVRGTVRLALKSAGLDAGSVTGAQMRAVLEKLLPKELESRGVEQAGAICESIAAAVGDIEFDGGDDRAGAAAEALGRFGRSTG